MPHPSNNPRPVQHKIYNNNNHHHHLMLPRTRINKHNKDVVVEEEVMVEGVEGEEEICINLAEAAVALTHHNNSNKQLPSQYHSTRRLASPMVTFLLIYLDPPV